MASLILFLKSAMEVLQLLRGLHAFIQENRNEAWFQKSFETFKELPNAKTVEEKRLAARRIRELIGGI